ncbi:SpoIIE family protein phosphatase [Luteolibacter sp. LG18]|uniref:SpoIIE family protein phosphatase n=1 Tax=Luteolibacter sp. LG18 TaxID=2819286 RepID=UPI002B2F1472|nr:hypothetical protein llg_42970 [Luteolibacter sp. LG18]
MSILPVPSTVTRFSIPPDPRLVGRLRELFVAGISVPPLTERDIRGWALAFNEAVCNAIDHGCEGRAGATITVEWSIQENAIRLAVEDPGEGPPESVLLAPRLPDDPFAESGRGLFILSEHADEIRGLRGAGLFRLELVKHHPGLSRTLDSDPEMEQALEELSTCYESLSMFYRLTQNFHGNAELASFIDGAIGDFLRLHDFQSTVFAGSEHLPSTVGEAIRDSTWFVPFADANMAITGLSTLRGEIVWNEPSDLAAKGIAPGGTLEGMAGCAIPITSGEVVFGSLIALRKAGRQDLKAGSLGILRTLADLCGIACANTHLGILRDQAQKKLGELAVAVEIQKALLPILPPPASPHWAVEIHQESSLQVAGDYAMATTTKDGSLVLFIIDVMGKGVSAALLASIFRSAFELSIGEPSPARLLEHLNRHLCTQFGSLTTFITCGTARYDPRTRIFDYAGAGHCPTLHYAADGRRHLIEPSGPPLGILPDITYQDHRIHLEGGARFIFLTDGCYEWDRASGVDDGWARFLALADSFQSRAADGLWDALTLRLREASGPALEDDCTLITLDIPPR